MNEIQFISIAVFVLLLVGTLISKILVSSKNKHETLQKVYTIIKSWWYIATPILLAFNLGPNYLMLFFFFVSSFAIYEFTKFLEFRNFKTPIRIILLIFNLFLYSIIYLNLEVIYYLFPTVILIYLVPILIFSSSDIKNLPRMAALGFGIVFLVFFISHISAFVFFLPLKGMSQEKAILAILLLIFTTELNDIFQFFSGKFFGRRKIIPMISPNKTEAGFIGGLVLTSILFLFLGTQYLDLLPMTSIVFGVIISFTGILGDLLFSAVKRFYGVKDFSDLIPGHGGVLDRIDSLILTVPIFYYLFKILNEVNL